MTTNLADEDAREQFLGSVADGVFGPAFEAIKTADYGEQPPHVMNAIQKAEADDDGRALLIAQAAGVLCKWLTQMTDEQRMAVCQDYVRQVFEEIADEEDEDDYAEPGSSSLN